MTRIRASCPTCGEVDLRPEEVVLHVVRAPDGLISDLSEYRFRCPSCADQVAKPADERIAQLLTTGGVPVAETPPELPPHPEFPSAGPPLTPDDLLDLHLLLTQPDWFSELVRDTPV
jgi:predicted RNA-binding Zn-ribbon protein involved in translation (DUF1610 family)